MSLGKVKGLRKVTIRYDGTVLDNSFEAIINLNK